MSPLSPALFLVGESMTLPPLAADRAAVTWEGPGEPITLTLYSADGEAAAVSLLVPCFLAPLVLPAKMGASKASMHGYR